MTNRDDIDRLETLLDAIEEMLLNLSNTEFAISDDQSRADAEIGKSILGNALKADGQRRMGELRKEMLASQKEHQSVRDRIPSDTALRRQLLNQIMQSNSNSFASQLTRAFRDGKEITDAEVDSIVAALDRLGAFGADDS